VDLKPLISTFALVFIAELGDKTQLAAMCQAAKFGKPWMVFIGASLALVVVSGIGVAVGNWAGACFPEQTIRYVAAGLFIAMGILMAFKVI